MFISISMLWGIKHKVFGFERWIHPNSHRKKVPDSSWRTSREMWETRRRILLKILLRLAAERESQTAHLETANRHVL